MIVLRVGLGFGPSSIFIVPSVTLHLVTILEGFWHLWGSEIQKTIIAIHFHFGSTLGTVVAQLLDSIIRVSTVLRG